MTKKRIEIRVDEQLYELLQKDRIKKGFEDKQDLILDILEKKYIKTFFQRFKELFKF